MASYIGKTDQPAPQPNLGADILARIIKLSQDQKGVFVGEDHNEYIARDFIITHLKELKSAGFDTISVELRHPTLQALRAHGIPCLFASSILAQKPDYTPEKVERSIKREGLEALPAYANADARMYRNAHFFIALAAEAKKHGIRVIGHDTYINEDNSDDPPLMDERDANGSEIIRKTALNKGKVLVFGGAGHSRKAGLQLYDETTKETLSLKEGLPQRLGIPTINITPLENLDLSDADRAIIQADVDKNGYAAVVQGDTTVMIHKNGQTLAPDAFTRLPYGNDDPIKLAYDIPPNVFYDPLCQPNRGDTGTLLSPQRIEEVIRNINAERGK